MHLNILCSGYLVRYPLGGQSWHHLQYLVGFRRLKFARWLRRDAAASLPFSPRRERGPGGEWRFPVRLR